MLMVSKAQVLSASKPDFSDIITLQASGVPVKRQKQNEYEPTWSFITAVKNR